MNIFNDNEKAHQIYGLCKIISSWLMDFSLLRIDRVALCFSDKMFCKNFVLRPFNSLFIIRVFNLWTSLSVLFNVLSTCIFFVVKRAIRSDFVLVCFFIFHIYFLYILILFIKKSIKSSLKFANFYFFEYNCDSQQSAVTSRLSIANGLFLIYICDFEKFFENIVT